MRLLVDAVGCRHDGVTTYWTNLLSQWVRDHPADELVLLRATTDDPWDCAGVEVRTVRTPSPDVLGRPLALTRELRSLARRLRPDAVLAVRPSTTVAALSVPLAVVVHDLRHELRPEQFTRARRAVRRVSWGASLRAADGVICISQRTADDLRRLHPRLRARPNAVIHHGADHTDSWPTGRRQPSVVAFGHHANKNVELVLAAWSRVVGSAPAPLPPLEVLGLGADDRHRLGAAVRARGLEPHVRLSPFLPDDDFHAAMADARAVVYPSDFEGFGLPVVEAMRLGKPVVVSPDPAIEEVAGGLAFAMTDWSEGALVRAVTAALDAEPGRLAAARAHVERFTWSATVDQTRGFLLGLSAGRTASS